MELFRSESYYIFVKNESSLWWNRLTGAFSVRSAWDMSDIEDIECLGITHGIIGKVEHSNVFEPRLIIIKEAVPVGTIYFHHTIYKIKSICFLNMGPVNQEVELSPCTKHGSLNSMASSNKSLNKKMGARLFENSVFLNKTVGAVKNVSNTIKTTTQQAATQVKQTVKKQRDPKIAERFEKRLTDELHKIFDDSDSFYYSRTLDLTNSLQRQYEIEKKLEAEVGTGKPVVDITKWWKHVDDRFFWNRHMLNDIIALGSPDCDQWILPIIQGYVHLAQIAVEPADANPLNTESLTNANSCDETFTLGVISRRSRYQAGTRYNRRGIDSNGKVANYVETEQIVSIICSDSIHRASFVQVRGSVPIFWSQPDSKFRPPPRLDKTEEESQEAFKQHFAEELRMYRQVCVVNLVEQQGRERVIWEAYGAHVLQYNSPDLIYATFDFHEYCRGMHYENVSILINAIADIIGEMRFCWRDDRGLICAQAGVFRVNCIDCLDRTNVVQTAIAKSVLELQLCRLGLGAPGAGLPAALRHAFLTMWADNGDVVSRQYAGTKALKGDYTRTGERKFTGMMKDGVASANRYLINHFSDAMKQCAIDILQGQEMKTKIEELDSFWVDLKTASMMVYENMDVDRPKLELVPSYYGHTLMNEFLSAEIVYGLGRYYLSTFKDALRQVAIDVQTGQAPRIPDQLIVPDCGKCTAVKVLMFNDQSEADTAAMAQHVKSLIDDCKKLLVDTEPVLGSWGLIDADPNTGDPQETEMDSVVLLTSDAYYVADYDDTSDRLLAAQRVPLADVTAIELGPFDANSTLFSVGRKSCPEAVHCVRINYSCGGEPGYFHMFRSTNLRFFNNVAVVINTRDEMIESLHSICESIIVARDVAKLPPIPFHDGAKLEKRKSKVHPSHGQAGGARASLYPDLSRLPTLTRNVSETQLVADIRSVDHKAVKVSATSTILDQILRIVSKPDTHMYRTIVPFAKERLSHTTQTVRSKALNNMSEQFSKLNKLSHSLNARARPSLQLKFDQGTSRTKKIFTLGQNKNDKKKGSLSDGLSSDYSSDDETRTNIFEPTLDNFENTQHYIGKPGTGRKNEDNDCELIENPLYSSKIEPSEPQAVFVPTEVVTNVDKNATKTPINVNKFNPFDIDTTRTPEIHVDSVFSKPAPPNSLLLTQKLSHSSNELNFDDNQGTDTVNYHRSNSQHEISLNIAQSHSESALRQLKNIASPVSSSTKDMVLSPLTKFAKGVQNLGANLDPRKIKGSAAVKQISEQQYEEHRQLQEKWRGCNTRLVAL